MRRRVLINFALTAFITATVHLFTSVHNYHARLDADLNSIHHPFLLSDNRHYTFYIWRRVFRLHFLVPYLLAPVYLACAWAWFLRLGELNKIYTIFDLTGNL